MEGNFVALLFQRWLKGAKGCWFWSIAKQNNLQRDWGIVGIESIRLYQQPFNQLAILGWKSDRALGSVGNIRIQNEQFHY